MVAISAFRVIFECGRAYFLGVSAKWTLVDARLCSLHFRTVES
jgi:hypothetical protein